ncbi:hypothetical protein J2Z58_002007 [Halobacillus andaensis]|nr:hypothetical protein [Halobacillus andaensis]
MGFVSRHEKRDRGLPEYREHLLEKALEDLMGEPGVIV